MNKILISSFFILVLGFAFWRVSEFKSTTPPLSQQSTKSTFPTTSTKQTACTRNSTPSQTEGPYYKTGSPKRDNIAEGMGGEKLVVSGYVYDKDCNPIPNA